MHDVAGWVRNSQLIHDTLLQFQTVSQDLLKITTITRRHWLFPSRLPSHPGAIPIPISLAETIYNLDCIDNLASLERARVYV